MLKKNIARTMAAATIITAAAPMTASFADVVNNTQEQEIKELKAKVLELFNTKYTKNQALLEGDYDTVAGECVYEISIGDGEPFGKYADFEAAFDREFSKLKNGDVIKVKYESTTPFRILEDEKTVVDFEDTFYTVIPASRTTKEILNITDSPITSDLGGIVYGNTADGKAYAKIPVTDGYITVKENDIALDLTRPIFKVVDGNYVDANGNAIKAFDETAVVDDVNTVLSKGGVIEGYYREVNPFENEEKYMDQGVVAIVKNATSLVKEDVTVADLYEASTDRLTLKGNELRKFLSLPSTVNKDDAVESTTLVKSVYGINKAGEKCGLGDANLAEIKVLFEQRENSISEWVPVYEMTITPERHNPLSIVIDHIIDNESMVDGMDLAAGLDRYQTSVELSKKGWNEAIGTAFSRTGDEEDAEEEVKEIYANTVVLVSGANDKLVDGLTATPLAAQKDAPVLLTNKDSIPKEVIAEIERLGAETIYIVGGESAVSKEVEELLVKKYSKEVIRLAGDSRYETSITVAEEMMKDTTNPVNPAQMFVVGGKGEADALSISAIAAEKVAPILLTPAADLEKSVEGFLKANLTDIDTGNNNDYIDIFVVGGENSVSKKVQSQLANIPGTDFEVMRLAGEGRQETNAAVINHFADKTDLTEGVVVGKSNNESLVDSLSAGAYAAKTNSHIVLATDELTDSQEDALDKLKEEIDLVEVKTQAGYGIAEKVAKFIKGL